MPDSHDAVMKSVLCELYGCASQELRDAVGAFRLAAATRNVAAAAAAASSSPSSSSSSSFSLSAILKRLGGGGSSSSSSSGASGAGAAAAAGGDAQPVPVPGAVSIAFAPSFGEAGSNGTLQYYLASAFDQVGRMCLTRWGTRV